MPAEIYRRIFIFMARPQRNSVDYFPFLCKEGTTMYYIEQKYGNDGFATWIKLLRQLAVTDYHYLNLSSKPQVMFLSAKCKVSENTLLLIIQDLCDMGEFEAFLWEENRVIFSKKFVAHVQDAYAKRSNKCIDLPGLLLLLEGLGVRKSNKELSKLPLKGPVNPQSKEEYSKEEETKEEDSTIGAGTPATIDERKKVFYDRCAKHVDKYSKEMLREFYSYWTEMNEGGRRMRFEMQKVFDLGRRLATWKSNETKKINGNGKQNKGTSRGADAQIEFKGFGTWDSA